MMQKFVKATAKVCEQRGKIYENHGKSLWTTRQKFMKVTAKICEQRCNDKNLWSTRKKLMKDMAKSCEQCGKILQKSLEKFVKMTTKVCKNHHKSLGMTTPKLLQEIAAEVILKAEVMLSLPVGLS